MTEQLPVTNSVQVSALFRLMADRIPGVVWATDTDLRFTASFGAGLASLGLQPSEAVGKTLFEYFQTDDASVPFFVAHYRALQREAVDVEQSWHGRMYQVHVESLVDEAQAVIGCVGFAQDITDRKLAEKELQEVHDRLERRILERTAELTQANRALQREVDQRQQAEEKLVIFRRFTEAATQGFGMADVDGRMIYANPFLARLFGAQRPEDVIGQHVSSYYPPEYLVRREREILPALRARGHWQGEQMLVFPDGQLHSTIHSLFAVHDASGELMYTAGVITDISELKRAEAALRQSYEELRRS